ncbi:hypothetical protein F1188_11180 [Roseospira marina]|uniref:Uncharacterized protein n=1 Tax=Roseospira marina TaxID=140057 RepID=A0A5M6IB52_9PROT|nr:hypothetical protein [Roseospira marina]KAA5605453.1 hypothetical protein F1188_11180 [Roseospira marina]MBB4314547.1 hypothetical protein [Roseospira marina]MBB5088891.1 hypothetical protein [Roseospira marina]
MTAVLAILHDAGAFDAVRAELEQRATRPCTDCLRPGVLRARAENLRVHGDALDRERAADALISLATLIEAGALDLRRPNGGA